MGLMSGVDMGTVTVIVLTEGVIWGSANTNAIYIYKKLLTNFILMEIFHPIQELR